MDQLFISETDLLKAIGLSRYKSNKYGVFETLPEPASLGMSGGKILYMFSCEDILEWARSRKSPEWLDEVGEKAFYTNMKELLKKED